MPPPRLVCLRRPAKGPDRILLTRWCIPVDQRVQIQNQRKSPVVSENYGKWSSQERAKESIKNIPLPLLYHQRTICRCRYLHLHRCRISINIHLHHIKDKCPKMACYRPLATRVPSPNQGPALLVPSLLRPHHRVYSLRRPLIDSCGVNPPAMIGDKVRQGISAGMELIAARACPLMPTRLNNINDIVAVILMERGFSRQVEA
jgi:hypothetical protein